MKLAKLIGIVLFYFIIPQNANSQDVLFFKNGAKLAVEIQRQTGDEIYYLKTLDDNTLFKILKSDLRQVNYAKGDSIIFSTTNSKTLDSQHTKSTGLKAGVKHATYKCWIFGDSDLSSLVRKGFMNSVNDSGIVFRVSVSGNMFPTNNWKSYYRDASSIDQIKLRRRGNIGKGIIIGAGAGFLFGGILGYFGIPDYGIFESLPPEQNALTGSILFSIPGMVIGGIVGSFRIKIPINKNQMEYERQMKLIASYSKIIN